MKLHLNVFLGLVLLCASCSKQESNESEAAENTPASTSADGFSAEENSKSESAETHPSKPEMAVAPTARLLVYHAEVRVKTDNLRQASARLDSLVQKGGFVSAATENRENGQWRTDMTIRVEPARFQALLATICKLGIVEEKKLNTDDVTAEHADIAARLRTKRAVEARYVGLLANAKSIKEVLQVEEKISEVREEIEATESRLKALNDAVAYSTITVSLYQPIAETIPDAPVVSWSSRVVEAFYGGWQLFASLLVGLVTIWPLWVFGSIGFWLWQRRKAWLNG
jgi:hypothetical protein